MTWSINYWHNKETQYPGSTKSSKTKQLHQLSVCPKLYTAVFQQWNNCPPKGTGPSGITVPMASPDPALIRHCLPIAHTKHPLTPLTSNNDLTHPRIALYGNQDVLRKRGRGWSTIKRRWPTSCFACAYKQSFAAFLTKIHSVEVCDDAVIQPR